ncbi:MAG: C4-dicarboxylate ABC transporter substrate-binding protein, partial [Desulfobacterales bacterium]|nr:C4-dicarboxylate ABC transporter substrate-binding protein [Desulfobacterales bacterium]
SLPKDVQKVFEAVSAKYIAKAGAVWDDGDKAGRNFTLERGNKIIPLSAEEGARWAKAVEPVIADYVKRAEGKGLTGKEYVETLRALIKKYSK